MTERDVRTIEDSAVLAALAHPLRRRLMDVLRVYGPCTVSTLADKTGQAVGNVSHHLKALRAGNLVEEVPELARDRRERWWRRVSSSLRWSTAQFQDDPAAAAITDSLQSLNLTHHVDLVRAWHAAPEPVQRAWGEGPFTSDRWFRMTPEELYEFSEELNALLLRWGRREVPDDGRDREPVFVFAYGVPGQP